jgi:hypothetical protein
MVEH